MVKTHMDWVTDAAKSLSTLKVYEMCSTTIPLCGSSAKW